jgi:hypothetical protein
MVVTTPRDISERVRGTISQTHCPQYTVSVPNSQEDLLVGEALAFLLHSTTLPPLHHHTESPYRIPDRPYSLFEGLAGAICSWSEACVYISKRLGGTKADVLGMPGIGGIGIKGLL